jgi:pyrroloquinoline quinone biosynthesis protein B
MRWLFVLALVGCGAAPTVPDPSPRPEGVFVAVLGSAQDAGIPQLASRSPASERARRDPRARRLAASLLLADARTGRRWLVDATPDIRAQVDRADALAPRPDAPGRPPLFDAVFLTHAHVGHYTGLLHFGREAYAAEGQPVRCSPRMAAFLAENAPWELLLRGGHVVPETFAPDVAVELSADLRVTPLEVPHRAEYTDTFGFLVEGPRRSLLYIPDIDKWERWDRSVDALIREVDVALLDGTFADDGELPGRSMDEVPHPFLRESLDRFGRLPRAERAKVHFTHLNHSNLALDPAAPIARELAEAGMHVIEEGQVFPL